MKKKPTAFCFLITVLGIAGMIVRYFLYQFGPDSQGLLPAAHPLEILLWILTALTALLVLLFIRSPEAASDPVSGVPASVGTWAMALAILLTLFTSDVSPIPLLTLVHRALAVLSALGLAAAGYFRMRGKKPVFGCYLAAALFFAVHAVARYRTWSSIPQMQSYVFSLLGCILLALFAYQQSAAQSGISSRGMRLFSGFMGFYCCCAALPQGEFPTLYLAGALWAMTSLWYRRPAPEKEGS